MSIITSERIAQINAQITAHWEKINAIQLDIAHLEDVRSELMKVRVAENCPHRRACEVCND